MPVPDAPVVDVRPRRRRGLGWLGIALAGYGAIGLVLFAVVAIAVARPLERARQLSASVEAQRLALIDSLDQAQTTIGQMADGVNQMDASLADARVATDRGATIAHDTAQSMYQLRDAMSVSIFGAQPFVGLAPPFDLNGAQLDLLGNDLAAIGTALETNRSDALTTADGLSELAISVGQLATAVRDAPDVEISAATLEGVRLAVYAICGWLGLLAAGCLAAGLYLVRLSRRRA